MKAIKNEHRRKAVLIFWLGAEGVARKKWMFFARRGAGGGNQYWLGINPGNSLKSEKPRPWAFSRITS